MAPDVLSLHHTKDFNATGGFHELIAYRLQLAAVSAGHGAEPSRQSAEAHELGSCSRTRAAFLTSLCMKRVGVFGRQLDRRLVFKILMFGVIEPATVWWELELRVGAEGCHGRQCLGVWAAPPAVSVVRAVAGVVV